MANDALTQQALAADPAFQRRVKSALATVAFQVLNEVNTTPGHAQRFTYAQSVITNLNTITQTIAGWLVMRTNVFGFTTSVSLATGAPVVVTAATDADLQSQLSTDWNILSNLGG